MKINTQQSHNELADMIENGLALPNAKEGFYFLIHKDGFYEGCAIGLAYLFIRTYKSLEIKTNGSVPNMSDFVYDEVKHLISEETFNEISFYHNNINPERNAKSVCDKLRVGFFLSETE